MTDPRRILVLGAAGGIASELITRLESRGDTVLPVTHRTAPRQEGELAVEAMETGEIEQCLKEVATEGGRVDGVVNLIGSLVLQPPSRLETQDFLQTLQLHAGSCFEVLRAVPNAVKSGGSVVFTSTAATHIGLANHEAIAAAKAAIEGMTRSAAATLAPRRVRVNAVAPGLVDTPLASFLTEKDAVRKASEAMHATGRIGTPEDIAEGILFLLNSTWTTGQVLRVDGGLSRVRTARG